MEDNVVVAITGASGMAYARRLLQVLCDKGIQVHLSMSEAALIVIRQELGLELDIDDPDIDALVGRSNCPVWYYKTTQLDAPLASGGSFPAGGMVIAPCSMNTLNAVAGGLAMNLIQRAAGVALKEGRKLVVVPRETPLTSIHLENMLRLSRAGACVLPAMPGFYHYPEGIDDIVDFMVAKMLNSLGVEHNLLVPKEKELPPYLKYTRGE
ncbi:MAG: UbiX family flavin prenyltransferase [Planctomycetes bacterium]|nr:UbiX family flavin prenyltransferase [Planctomycetota bacterium]